MMGTTIDITHLLSDFVAFWPFCEGSGGIVNDLSGGNTGTCTGTIWVPGKYGSALDFSGGGSDDKVDCGKNVGTVGAKTLTLLVYVKFDSLPTGGASQVHLAGRYWGDNTHRVIACRIVDSTTARLVTCDGVDEKYDDVTISLATDIWYCMVWTYSAGVGNFYLDGINQGSFSGLHSQLNSPATSSSFTLGVDSTGFGDLDGQIDHAMVYNRALSASEIALLHREPFYGFMNPDEMPVLDQYYAAPPVGIPILRRRRESA